MGFNHVSWIMARFKTWWFRMICGNGPHLKKHFRTFDCGRIFLRKVFLHFWPHRTTPAKSGGEPWGVCFRQLGAVQGMLRSPNQICLDLGKFQVNELLRCQEESITYQPKLGTETTGWVCCVEDWIGKSGQSGMKCSNCYLQHISRLRWRFQLKASMRHGEFCLHKMAQDVKVVYNLSRD